jgi:glycosyltransferase involved in cell wall biosynthesis
MAQGPSGAPARVLFFVEGNTDIRFVAGLSRICTLTMAIPAGNFRESGLHQRLDAAGVHLQVEEIPGNRLRFQIESLRYLLKNARNFDLILCQEVLRGALSCTLTGAISGTPVITYMGISPLEYFRCRRERRQISAWKAWVGESLIRFLMTFNGRFATRCLVMGNYLREVSLRYCPRTEIGLYYGVDTDLYRPVDERERRAVRRKRELPDGKFVIFLSSRISHEKDPETVLRATAMARERGLDAVAINLGGGYREFLGLAKRMFGEQAAEWVLGRPAAHPMLDLPEYYQAADCLAQGSLEEGLGLSPMEALACGTPAICTDVGGLKHLREYAQLTPRRDAERMCQALLWIAANPSAAREQALLGREYVAERWSRAKAFADLAGVIEQTIREGRGGAKKSA